MGRQRNELQLDEICEVLQAQPDQKPGTVAQLVGLNLAWNPKFSGKQLGAYHECHVFLATYAPLLSNCCKGW